MDKDKRYEFYEKIYFNELEDMNKILSRFPILIAGMALILNAYIFIIGLSGFKELPNMVQLGFLFSMFFAMIWLLFFMYKTFTPLTYETVAILTELEAKRREFDLYAAQQTLWNADDNNIPKVNVESSDQLFGEDLLRSFIDYSSRNRGLNNQKRKYFSQTLKLICVNFGLCLVMLASSLLMGVN